MDYTQVGVEAVKARAYTTGGDSGYTPVYIDTTAFTVTIVSPCASSLTTADAAPANTYSFVWHASNTETIEDSTYFFKNTQGPTDCEITSCTIFATGCSTAYAGTYSSDYLSVAPSTPFAISSSTAAVQLGWTQTICISCTNGD